MLPTKLRFLRPVVSSCQLSRRPFAVFDDKRWMASEKEIEDYSRQALTRGEKLTSGMSSPQFYQTTLDDNYQRTTVTITNTDEGDPYVAIASFTNHGFRLNNGNMLLGPVAVFPKVALSWMVASVDHITEKSVELFALIEPKLDLLILGVGDAKNVDLVRKRLTPFFRRHRLNVEILETQHACATFNYLNSERRCIAAALFPPDEIQTTKSDDIKMFSQHSPEFGEAYSANQTDFFGVPKVPGTDGTIGALKKLYQERQKRLSAEDKDLDRQLGVKKPQEDKK